MAVNKCIKNCIAAAVASDYFTHAEA